MAKKEFLKGFGFSSIMNFLRRGKIREKKIAKFDENQVFVPSQTNLKAAALHPKTQEGTLVEITPMGDKGNIYTFQSDGFAFFRAGQYVNIRLNYGKSIIARPISIVSSPLEALDGKLSLAIASNPKGYFAAKAPELLQLYKTFEFSGPSGDFYYSSTRDEPHVIAAAGGIGITPIISMAKAILEGSEDFKLTILYGVKNEKEAVFAPLLSEICSQTDKVSFRLFYENKGEYITSLAIKAEAGNSPYSLFVCGPQGMYEAFDKIAKELGLDQKHYRKEIFGSIKSLESIPSYPGSKQKTYKGIIHMVDKIYEMELPYDQPILYALEKEGIATPNRCRGGICGYCRGRILKGEVYIPEIGDGRREEDKKKGYAHLCMTYPLSDVEIEIPAP